MAAAPEGSTVLSFEDEETAMLDATDSIGMDLTVSLYLGQLLCAAGHSWWARGDWVRGYEGRSPYQ